MQPQRIQDQEWGQTFRPRSKARSTQLIEESSCTCATGGNATENRGPLIGFLQRAWTEKPPEIDAVLHRQYALHILRF
jgi:hypothetical protein